MEKFRFLHCSPELRRKLFNGSICRTIKILIDIQYFMWIGTIAQCRATGGKHKECRDGIKDFVIIEAKTMDRILFLLIHELLRNSF